MDEELQKILSLIEPSYELDAQYKSRRVLNLAVRYILAITTVVSIVIAFITPERYGLAIAVVLALGLHLIFSEADHYKYKKKVKVAHAIYELDRIHNATLTDAQRKLLQQLINW